MNEEEKKKLEEAAKVAREAADAAHAKAAEADGTDEALNSAADTAEDAAVAAQAAYDAATVAPTDEEVITPAAEEESSEEDIDFEKELENLGQPPKPPAQASAETRTELEKATRSLHFNAQRVKELGGDPAKILKPADEQAQPPVQTEQEQPGFVTQADLDKRDLKAELRKLAKTDAELQVLAWHAEHSIRPTGDAQKDAENAYFIAHKGKIKRSFDEIRRAGYSRPAPGGAPGRRQPAKPAVPALSQSDHSSLVRRGFKKQADGTYEGKKYRVRYDATKKSWVTEKKTP